MTNETTSNAITYAVRLDWITGRFHGPHWQESGKRCGVRLVENVDDGRPGWIDPVTHTIQEGIPRVR